MQKLGDQRRRVPTLVQWVLAQGTEKDIDIKEYVPETVLDVCPAVPGRGAIVHD